MMDNMPDLTAALDQSQMACRTMAQASHLYMIELLAAGFTRHEAYGMVLTWQEAMYEDDPHEH